MDGLTPDERTDALRELYALEFAKVIGTDTRNRAERAGLYRKLTRKLSAHFDAAGWPRSREEALPYVRKSVERYG